MAAVVYVVDEEEEWLVCEGINPGGKRSENSFISK